MRASPMNAGSVSMKPRPNPMIPNRILLIARRVPLGRTRF